MPKIDIDAIPVVEKTGYPEPYDAIVEGRLRQALGDAGGLNQIGVNLTRLKPGAGSAHRHWHAKEDEFIYILDGEALLIEDTGETILRAGDAAGFKAGVENGHQLINRSDNDVIYLEVGTRSEDDISSYTDPDVDMKMVKVNGDWQCRHKNGDPY